MKIYKPTLLALLLLGASFAQAEDTATITGIYNTGPSTEPDADGSSLNIEFGACAHDAALSCGTIVEIVDPVDTTLDTLPDGSPIIGYVMVKDLKAKGSGKFRSGKVAAIDESMSKGKMIWYGIKIDDTGEGVLNARGCLGFICPREMVWTAVPETADAE